LDRARQAAFCVVENPTQADLSAKILSALRSGRDRDAADQVTNGTTDGGGALRAFQVVDLIGRVLPA